MKRNWLIIGLFLSVLGIIAIINAIAQIETVEQQLCRSYLITKVAQLEGIDASEDDINAEIETMVETSGEQGEQVRQLFMNQENRDSIVNVFFSIF